MKKRSLISLLLASAMAVSVAAGCVSVDNNNENNNNNNNNNNEPPAPTQPVQLSAPQITLTGNVISWSAVDNATGYDVYEGTTVVSTAQTALSYTINKTEAGEYTFTVKAVSTDEKYTASNASNSVTYTVKDQNPPSTGDTDTSVKLTGKVYLVGDSTVCSFSDSYYIPRYGYGTQLYNYLNCDANQIVNLALSGRSSTSFLLETDENQANDPKKYKNNYSQLIKNISEGDYLLIGFGHNDQKADIYSNPNLSYTDSSTTNGVSFKYNLYENYIKVAQEAGATPILCTPIVRANEKNDYSGSSGHITATSGSLAGGDYAQAIRDLGAAVNVDVIDLTALTKADYTALGYEKALNYHAFTTAKWTDDSKTEKIRAGEDKTHTNLYGAKMNAYHIASELLKLTDNPLSKHVKTNIVKPTYDSDYAASINADFTIADYKPFEASMASSSWSGFTPDTNGGWYGTAFGSLGVNSKYNESFAVRQNSVNSFTVSGLKTDKGKIQDAEEGIAAAFKQVGYNANFEITATVTVDTFNDNSGTGFGIMLRDDIYIDKNDKSILSNYVAAGCYGTSSAAKFCYYRDNPASISSSNTGRLDISAQHTLSIKRSGTTVTVKFDNYTYTTVADFDLRGVDSEYMYICLYSTRGTAVTFTNVTYTDLGEGQA